MSCGHASGVPALPPPNGMVWQEGGVGWRVRTEVGGVGAAAGGAARGHREGQARGPVVINLNL